MKKATELINDLKNNKYDELLNDLYVDESLLEYQRNRYVAAVEKYISLYGDNEVEIYSAPGRSEVGGNHTDHQHGCVLAAAINLDAIAVVGKTEREIKILSDDFDIKAIDVNDLAVKQEEAGSSEALVRGVLAKLKELNYQIGGFNAFITSDVIMGAGLSSSAAFETIIGTILSGLYNDMTVDPVLIAQIGQYAENVYFGKPCGLMDQCASSVGSLINIDFKDIDKPVVRKVDVDFSKFEHSLCIVDTKGSHADLTDEYAAIPAEMKKIANYFNKEFLREVDEQEFFDNIAKVREIGNDRAVLRAIHLFTENKRVDLQVAALNAGDFDEFKRLIKASGDSSYKFLQNVYANSDVFNQSVSIGLAMSEKILGDNGVCRVHGGGFAGTIQAFVKDSYVDTYKTEIEKVFGKDSCHILKVRKYGGKKVIY
ncbi:galactokinase [Erysipelatoclostridium sp. An173]|uniref:galactokinase n=1 Tax=Erysipelatoclostridium sp. An173 TaxID=1965571 RepID=UPI000B36522E|nr:galactokinase family protein [Erysipelatoclostridium sp. An173]OUP77821.1 galactokinase [Erysipelatoclostridium sp. An173]